MKAQLIRDNSKSNDKVTLGSFYFNGVHFCETMELPWNDNQRRISCIIEGRYKVIAHDSPKFGDTFWIQDVPNRSEILIHPANFTRQLLGCVAPGLSHRDIDGDGIIDVASSRKAMDILLEVLPKKFELEITWQ